MRKQLNSFEITEYFYVLHPNIKKFFVIVITVIQ